MTTPKRKAKTQKPEYSDEKRWQAIVNRDVNADGQFYYCVSTTGVYCRPSCPSRLAKRDHVVFHVTVQDAELAEFRPCRRCKHHEVSPSRRRETQLLKPYTLADLIPMGVSTKILT
jgi:AraC family transcriptional regulator of adaptative response/methylated-DNA-[protein]-cysteine methyltransferase